MRTTASIIVALLLLGGVGRASAQSPDQVAIKQAQLTVSAFECQVVAPDNEQGARLFNLAIKNGRAFIAATIVKPELYSDRKMPEVWLHLKVFMPDFALGQMYAALEDEHWNKLSADPKFDPSDFNPDPKITKSINYKIFQEKNCALLK